MHAQRARTLAWTAALSLLAHGIGGCDRADNAGPPHPEPLQGVIEHETRRMGFEVVHEDERAHAAGLEQAP